MSVIGFISCDGKFYIDLLVNTSNSESPVWLCLLCIYRNSEAQLQRHFIYSGHPTLEREVHIVNA